MISNRVTVAATSTPVARESDNDESAQSSRDRSGKPFRTTTVAVASAEPVTLSGLATVIGAQDDFDVVHTETDIEAALAALAECSPDVFAVESCFAGTCVLEAIERAATTVPVLVVSRHQSSLVLRRALRCGARGFVSRGSSAEALLTALGTVASDSVYMEPGLVAELAEQSVLPGLTERELGILYLVAIGYTSAEISGSQFISARTVEACRASIKSKLGLRTRAQIHSYARDQGMLSGCDCVPTVDAG